MTRIYVTQFDCTWSLTPEAWRKAVEASIAGKEFNWDDLGKRLSRKISAWEKQHQPLDWDLEEWEDELKNLKGES